MADTTGAGEKAKNLLNISRNNFKLENRKSYDGLVKFLKCNFNWNHVELQTRSLPQYVTSTVDGRRSVIRR